MHGHVIVVERHHRLDALFEAGAKHILIEREALLVGFGVIPVGEYTAPCDGEAQSLEAHLAEERDVLAVMMIEIDGLLGRVVMVGQRLERNVVTPDDGETVPPVRQKIRVGEPPPPSSQAPSHWLAESAPPQRKSERNGMGVLLILLLVRTGTTMQRCPSGFMGPQFREETRCAKAPF